MWIALASIAILFISSDFRKMVRNTCITVPTSIIRRYRQWKSVYSAGKWTTRKVVNGDAKDVRDLLNLQFKTWLINRYNLGYLRSEKDRYVLTYCNGEKIHKVYFPKSRKIRNIVSAITYDDRDVTRSLLEALGPSYNFHGIPTTPKLLGHDRGLKIEYRRGRIVHVLPNDIIRPFEV